MGRMRGRAYRHLLAGLVIGLACCPAAGATTLSGRVIRVVDGDTIHVSVRGFDDDVRVIGIDTPETKKPNTPVECGGPEASKEMERTLPPGTEVTLVTDPTQDTRDRYGRLLAYVDKAGRGGAAGSVNYALVAAGFARVYVFEHRPFEFAPAFFRAQAQARKARRGIWGPPCNGNTSKPEPALGY